MKSKLRIFILFVLSSLICVLFLGSFKPYQAQSLSSSFLSEASYSDSANLSLTGTIIANAITRTSGLWVHSLDGDDVRHGRRGVTNRDNLSTTEIKTTLGPRQQLRIGGDGESEATLGFLDINDTFSTDYLVAAGRSFVVSHYYYSPSQCRTSGEFVIGWTEGRPLDPDAPVSSLDNRQCPDISHRPGLIGPAAQSRKTPENYVSLNLKSDSRRSFQNYIDAAAPVHLHYYCSAVEDDGEGWGIAFSGRPMSPTLAEANSEESISNTIRVTCQKAIETCEERSEESCSVANDDPWRIDAATPEFQRVKLVLQCQNEQYLQASGITPDEINESYASLEKEAVDNEDKACIFSIRYFYEILISPLNDERTLIHTTLTDEGYAIHDLIGSVDITVSDTSETTTTITLKAGDRFLFDYLLDSVQKQPKETIPDSERNAAANHPLVKTFLDVNKWPASFEPEITAYQEALQEQFLPSVPPVSAELVTVTVRGVDYQVWKATVNLSEPNVAFSLVRDCSVDGAASLTRFAQEQKAALVMGGIYGGQNRCDPLNYPLYSEGQLQAGSPQRWTQGTVLGMRSVPLESGIVAEMQTFNADDAYTWSSDQATWDQYLFAVTSGPRLLANGQVVYSEQAARAQGHNDPNVTNPVSRTRRAALCLSRDKQQFHYVMSQQPPNLNLVELSEILQSSPVDCWDAVNLDGGAGPALAVQGDVKSPPGGRPQPYLMVVYDAENVPSATGAAWNLP
ncbi:MAG: phosphodiester glycosidase family protein [Cyanobacteria bacterium P01_D01_bin.44]